MTARHFDLRSTVLVVVGHGILAEEEDRPVAYELKQAVNARAGGSEGRTAVAVSDVWLQMAAEGRRATLWGLDQAGTREAVDAVVKNGLLERFLDLVRRRTV